MKYILDGNPVDVSNVIKEQRIRIARGLVSLTPCPDKLEQDEALTRANEALRAEIEEVKAANAALESEKESLNERIAALEAPEADSKEPAEDKKDAPVADEKKPKKK